VLLKLVLRRSPTTEIILSLLVGLVVLAPFFTVFVPTAYQTLSLIALCVASMAGVAVTWCTRQQVQRSALPTLIAIVLVAAIGLQMISTARRVIPDAWRSRRSDARLYTQQRFSTTTNLPATEPLNENSLPHIYLIVLDAYGRSDVLQRLYGFDNSVFLEELRGRGFFVARRSRSNYHLTDLSIASTLNLAYLNGRELQHFRTRLPLRSMICDSILVRTLKQHGYETVAFETGKSTTECESYDRYLSPSKALSDLQDVLIHSTAIPPFLEAVQSWVPYWPSTLHRNRIAQTFEQLPLVTRGATTPTFVFAHVMAPHPPFVFDELGNARNLHGRYLLADSGPFHAVHDRSSYVDGYRRQLQHVNSQVLRMIDRIQSQASRPAVIIIQGDHGPRSAVNVSSPATSDMHEAFGILLAVGASTGASVHASAFYDEVTPVNIFRQILNSYFGTKLDMLEDRCYFENPIYSYQFQDVTQAATAPDAGAGADKSKCFIKN
jgi:hypothetical protein